MKARGRAMLAAAMLVLAMMTGLPSAVAQGYWQTVPDEGLYCRESRPGCHLLQMAMSGSFAALDLQDSISVRVFSAVLPQLCALTQEDFAHFTAQFGVEMETIKRIYYIAMSNCLLADIELGGVRTPEEAMTHRVLLLFLHPEGEEDADWQKSVIRSQTTDEVLLKMADSTGLPKEYIEYLIASDDWAALSP